MPPVVPHQSSISITNAADGEVVFTRLLLLQGLAGPRQQGSDGTIFVQSSARFQQSIVAWEVNDGYFKALVPLVQGSNELLFTYVPGRHASLDTLEGQQHLDLIPFTVRFEPPGAPPLHLVILMASDSPGHSNAAYKPSSSTTSTTAKPQSTPLPPNFGKMDRKLGGFMSKALNKLQELDLDGRHQAAMSDADRACIDTPPGLVREKFKQGGVDEVARRFALQAYMWQAFYAEQMRRHGFGRRGFALDDVAIDQATSSVRLEEAPRVHRLRSRHTLKEFLDPNSAQQNRSATNSGAMFKFATEAIEEAARNGSPLLKHSPVAVLVLDTRWDARMGLLKAHAALGGGGPGQLSLGVCGSHWIFSTPASLQDVTRALLNEERTDERHCCNDLKEGGTAWETLCIGSGAMMHEVGHAFNCPHTEGGIMARGQEYNRAFMTREGYNQRTGSRSARGFNESNDAKLNFLHRVQALRCRWHPSFHLPSDAPLPYYNPAEPQGWQKWTEAGPHWTPGQDGPFLSCAAGLASIEVEIDGKIKHHVEWTGMTERPPNNISVTATYLMGIVGFNPLSQGAPRVKLNALGCNMRQSELQHFARDGMAHAVQIGPSQTPVFKGPSTRSDDNASHAHWQQLFLHKFPAPAPSLIRIQLYGGSAFNGLTFHYSDGRSQAFGPVSGKAPTRAIDLQHGDEIERLETRCGQWVDGVEVVLRSGNRSGMAGNAAGGSARTLAPPPSHEIVGLGGSNGDWVDSLGIFTRKV